MILCISEELRSLVEVAKIEPQLAYAAYVYGLSKRWIYLMRTTPNISSCLLPLENAIRTEFLPCLVSHPVDSNLRNIFALPPKFGGLGIFNPHAISDDEYRFSKAITAPLAQAVLDQEVANIKSTDGESDTFSKIFDETKRLKIQIKKEKSELFQERQLQYAESLSEDSALLAKEACLKGASLWLTTLPLEEHDFILSKQEFADAIHLRYNLPIVGVPKHCPCGCLNDTNHALTCLKGGYTHLRHNKIRDITGKLLEEVCFDINLEPKLLPLSGEKFPLRSANVSAEARSDISARGVWQKMDKVFFDVRIFHPTAPSNSSLSDPFASHEQAKKREYNSRILEVEKASFVPLVFSTSGGAGKEATALIQRLSLLLANKRNISYGDAISFVRRSIRFSILKTTLIALRGYRGPSSSNCLDENSNIDLIPKLKAYV